MKAYQDTFPPEERFPIPSLLGTGYYNATGEPAPSQDFAAFGA